MEISKDTEGFGWLLLLRATWSSGVLSSEASPQNSALSYLISDHQGSIRLRCGQPDSQARVHISLFGLEPSQDRESRQNSSVSSEISFTRCEVSCEECPSKESIAFQPDHPRTTPHLVKEISQDREEFS